MKKFLLTLATLLMVTSGFSQGKVRYMVKVVQNQTMVPKKGMEVTAMETTTLKRVSATTNQRGIAVLNLKGGNKWAVSIGEMKQCRYVNIKPDRSIRKKESIVYDLGEYKRKQDQIDKRPASFETVNQDNIDMSSDFSDDECLLAVNIKHPQGKLLKDIKVEAVSIEDSTIYRSRTGKNGAAYFILPNETQYDIDVNGFRNAYYYDFGGESVINRLTIQFIPTKVKETVRNDTVYQKADKNTRPSSKRALVKLNIQGDNYEKNEKAYLDQLKSNKVWVSKINKNGYAYFLLPIKEIYMINFKYHKNVDVVNLEHATQRATRTMNVRYVPDPRLKNPGMFIPSPDKLFLKDFNHYLDKQYEKTREKPFLLNTSNALQIDKKTNTVLCKLTLTGSEQYVDSRRLPVNVAFVLDKSGSMHHNQRAKYLKDALWKIAESLTEEDRVSVTLFDNEAYDVTYIDEAHPSNRGVDNARLQNFRVLIDNYTPGGGTNIYKALQLGANKAKENRFEDRTNKLILLTDGNGITPPKKVLNYVEQIKNNGITVSTIGVGNSFNYNLLEMMAEKGNGNFRYVDSSSAISGTFMEEFSSTFLYGATDLEVEIAYDNEILEFKNIYGYAVKEKADDHVVIDIGKVPAALNKLAFLKFKLKKPASEVKKIPLQMHVNYQDVTKQKEVSYTDKIEFKRSEEPRPELLMDEHEQKLYAVATLNQALKAMSRAHDNGNQEKAFNYLQEGIKEVMEMYPDSGPEAVKKLIEKADKYLELLKREIEKK